MQIMVFILVLNMAALGLFWLDKKGAPRGWRRVPERSFLGLALLGGWPALKAGQRLFRHKTRKQPFGWQLNIAAALNLAALLAWSFAELV